jgi:hypothetical protein
MKIKYKNQPPYSMMCGQTVLAMVLDVEILDICFILNKHNQGTMNKDIYKVLDKFNIKYKYKRCKDFNLIPNKAIVKLGYYRSKDTHWILKFNDKYYDPSIGIIEQYNTDLVKPISYIHFF